ncbi:GGDEF domain-containing protein [Oceanotoga teriensis]|uniref:GGDEF domain-containing protein n=1 Tax=Oceanotoga teriensis TaxID=515440 RepID=UPI0027144A3F|nr:GGDEF domain-containing protein [Oceanotoga teriensis]MDO7975969.1 GGDEF domain-containing protein [Oceanotoga teriensis]
MKFNKIDIIFISILLSFIIIMTLGITTFTNKSIELQQNEFKMRQIGKVEIIKSSMFIQINTLISHIDTLSKSKYAHLSIKDSIFIPEIVKDDYMNHNELIAHTFLDKNLNPIGFYSKETNDKNSEIYSELRKYIENNYDTIKNIDDMLITNIKVTDNYEFFSIIKKIPTYSEVKYLIFTINLNSLIENYIKILPNNIMKSIFIIDEKKQIIHDHDEYEIGKNVEEIYKENPQIITLANKMVNNENGTETYFVKENEKTIQKLMSWTTLSMDERKIIIAMTEPLTEINQVITKLELIGIILGVVQLMFLMLSFYIYFDIKKKIGKEQSKKLEKIIHERTKELEKSKELISDQKEELEASNEQLIAYNEELIAQKEELEFSFEELNKVTEKFEEIIHIISKIDITKKPNRDQFLSDLFKSAMKITPEANYGSVFKYENDKIVFIDCVGHDLEKLQALDLKMEIFDPIPRERATIIKNINQYTLNNMEGSTKREFADGSKLMKETLTFDLKIDDVKIAGISLDIALESEKYFGNESLKVMEAFRNIANAFFKIQKSQEKLEKYANYDELTGIYNRRMGMIILEEQMKFTKRYLTPLSICFLDVNNLKITNDKFGHNTGDKLLTDITMLIKQNIREIDILCRMGGDEFLIIFPKCTERNAEMIWERIKKDFNTINEIDKKDYEISVAHGIHEYKFDSFITLDELISFADKKMYTEKRKMKKDDKC